MERKEFEMTEDDHAELMAAMKPVPLIMLQCGQPSSLQARANDAWKKLGAKYNFKHMTVRPVQGKSERFFTAEPFPPPMHPPEPLPQTYITFGQCHAHSIGGITFDKDCVALVNLPEPEARAIFWPKFCFSYTAETWDPDNLKWFPRGIVKLNLGTTETPSETSP